MRIVRRELFDKNLQNITQHIAIDSSYQAKRFKNNLKKLIINLNNYPYKFRQSYYYEDENIRDLVFKGYTIPYLIDKDNDIIAILEIFKWINKWQKKKKI